MRTIYIDCGMGAAGDMLTAALLDLFPHPEEVVEELNALHIPEVQFHLTRTEKCGITGNHMQVLVHGEEEVSEDVAAAAIHDHPHMHAHDHNHAHTHEHIHDHMHTHDHIKDHEHSHSHEHTHVHRGMEEIRTILAHLPISNKVRCDVEAVYGHIAKAESEVHGTTVEEIHFHEVGAMDAIADITAVCYLFEKLHADRILASPIHVGSGQVRCAHGILPVPAPATARILLGVPTYSGSIRGELCTPTGAALLKHFADDFGPMPVMKTEEIGYGMGNKDFPVANCIRIFLGETEEAGDEILELSCNLDDCTGEEIGRAMEALLQAGALDVFTVPIGMKKNRPGVLFTVLCRPEQRDAMVQLLFRHTTTLGVREHLCQRHVMHRTMETVETPYGPVRVKHVAGYGVERSKAEYEDLVRIAGERNMSLAQVRELVERSK